MHSTLSQTHPADSVNLSTTHSTHLTHSTHSTHPTHSTHAIPRFSVKQIKLSKSSCMPLFSVSGCVYHLTWELELLVFFHSKFCTKIMKLSPKFSYLDQLDVIFSYTIFSLEFWSSTLTVEDQIVSGLSYTNSHPVT